jgi:hypothetical protein
MHKRISPRFLKNTTKGIARFSLYLLQRAANERIVDQGPFRNALYRHGIAAANNAMHLFELDVLRHPNIDTLNHEATAFIAAALHPAVDARYMTPTQLRDTKRDIVAYIDHHYPDLHMIGVDAATILRMMATAPFRAETIGDVFEHADDRIVRLANIVRDADRAESLGDIGAQRMVQYIIDNFAHSLEFSAYSAECARGIMINHMEVKVLDIQRNFKTIGAEDMFAERALLSRRVYDSLIGDR